MQYSVPRTDYGESLGPVVGNAASCMEGLSLYLGPETEYSDDTFRSFPQSFQVKPGTPLNQATTGAFHIFSNCSSRQSAVYSLK
jgi:hypothetical protein